MSWLNLNESLNTLKGQITNFASEVLSEVPLQDSGDKEEENPVNLEDLQEKCRDQALEHRAKRTRDVNFTPKEKSLLTFLIKRKPIVLTKLTDGKTVHMKKLAWEQIRDEFNLQPYVHRRDTTTLKRAWINIKAYHRRVRSESLANQSDEGPITSEETTPKEIDLVVEADPMLCEMTNPCSNDEMLKGINEECEKRVEYKIESGVEESNRIDPKSVEGYSRKNECEKRDERTKCRDEREDYVRREAEIRVQHLEEYKEIKMQILKRKLETKEIKRRAAIFEEETHRILLEKAQLELEILKKNVL